MKGKVDILDLVEVTLTILPPNGRHDMAPLGIDIVPYDETKMIVLDEDELAALNGLLSDRAREMQIDPRDPNGKKYFQEFVARWLSEMYRNGLAELTDIPEGSDDPYAHVRQWKKPV